MMNTRQLFLRHVAQTSPSPLGLEIEKAKGCFLYDKAGKAYLDLIAGIGVSVLGHGHPMVIDAIKQQVDRYLHTMVYGEYILSPQVKLAQQLTRLLPETLDSIYFVNSGSEATEGAMKLAKRYTGRPDIISCQRAYHGSTQGAASLMQPKTFTRPFHPLLPGIKHIDFNCHACLARIDHHTAAVIVETVQAEWGVRTPAYAYLQALKARCAAVGALLILDEIQVGFGRTGSWFAFEQYGIVPDILLLAKGMGGGMPIGAFLANRHVMASLSEKPVLGHITTFGGHPVCCAAALATVETLKNGPWIGAVKDKEARFLKQLKHPKILDVRSAGLLLAVELADFDTVQQVIQYALKHGVITDWFLFNDRCLRIAPPLIISDQEIDEACAIIKAGLDEVKP